MLTVAPLMVSVPVASRLMLPVALSSMVAAVTLTLPDGAVTSTSPDSQTTWTFCPAPTMPMTMPFSFPVRINPLPPATLLELLAAALKRGGVAAIAAGVRGGGDEVSAAEALAQAVEVDGPAGAEVRQAQRRAAALDHVL